MKSNVSKYRVISFFKFEQMSGLAKVDDQWIPLQITVFTRWVNGQLKGVSETEIQDITKDLSNGVSLVQLAQVLTKKDAPRAWNQSPVRNVDMVQNCDLAIEMFKEDGVQIIGISGKDVNDNNQKLILGLIWSLILRYSISKSVQKASDQESAEEQPQQSNKSNKEALMAWANERVKGYANVEDFQPYDLAMCALLDSYVPDKINYNELTPGEVEKNSTFATNAMNDLGIPVYIYPEDVVKNGDKVDEKTLLTQLSSAKVVLDALPPEVHERSVQLQQERLAKKKAEEERALREKEEAERAAKEKEEAERLAKEKEEADRIAREKEEAERAQREKEEAERLAKEKEEADRLAAEKEEAERAARAREAESLAQNASDITSLRQIIEKLQQDLNNVQNQANEATNKANEAQAKADEANQRVADLTAENKSLKTDIKCLKYEVKKLKEEAETNQRKEALSEATASSVQPQTEATPANQDSIEKLKFDLKCLKYEVKKLKDERKDEQDTHVNPQ